MTISENDRRELQHAKNLLENPGVAAKITNYIGTPIEQGIKRLPKNWSQKVTRITTTALGKSADVAILTLKDQPGTEANNRWHLMGAALSGGVGGMFGLAALAVELPISTTIMLRSIADIARSQGESMSTADTKMACLEVFALGGGSKSDDAAESGYYMVRASLAQAVSQGAERLASSSLVNAKSPAILRLIALIAERFGVQVTEKAAAQLVPAIGAAGGAIVNTIFINHFQDMATGHFIVRRLERKYGQASVQALYQSLPKLSKS